ncbi:MAG: low-specificity L-threonine aldolase [candidate division WOR-3 bacterium]|nr:low-specificity L-threonine aldolase [candidate division WOR-3 bacterium]
MKIIDLRSDTVTLPTPRMRKAIFDAELGDDVFEEDPTVRRLENIAAEIMGKESALLVTSGTMGNLVSILTHCRRGDEVILGDLSHTFLNEVGGISALGGIHPHTVKNLEDGTMDLSEIESAIRSDNIHYPRTRLICIENTHNRCYGSPLSVKYTNEVCDLARKYNLKVHLDGARIFNAAVALNVDVKDLTRNVDSLSFCLSKGLSAPVGSVVCGTAEFIKEARRYRKMLGGGMRQAGIIAAAGIVALEDMIPRIKEDHDNARLLAEGISQIPELCIDLDKVKTNIVYFDLATDKISSEELLKRMNEKGIKFLSTGPNRFRMVTHYGITQEDIRITVETLKKVLIL